MTTSALLIIDVQKGVDDPNLGKRNNPQAETNMARLLPKWRENNGRFLNKIYLRLSFFSVAKKRSKSKPISNQKGSYIGHSSPV